MEALIPKWHRELELFSAIKPLLIMEGNITDQYRYPVDGSVRQDEIIPLSRYLHAYFSDQGYDQVLFYSNLLGFMSPYDPSMLERFANLTDTEICPICSDGTRITAPGATFTSRPPSPSMSARRASSGPLLDWLQ